MEIKDIRPLFKGYKNQRFKSWALDEDVQVLYDHIKSENIKTVFEIGTATGFSASCMALAGATVYTFDIEVQALRIYEEPLFPDQTLQTRIFASLIPSPECFKHMHLPPEPVILYIDGDHSREGALRDFEGALEISRPGDLIFMHDIIGHLFVSEVWADIEKRFPGKTTVFPSKYGLGLVRV